MRRRKLIQILAVLQHEERKEFADFLRSPLHSHRPKLAGMVELMEQKLFSHLEQQISSDDFYAQIYPGKNYDANDLNRSISVIMRELKSYLAFLQYRNDKGAQYGYFVKEVGERKWPGGSIGVIREVRKRLETEIEENPGQYYSHYELAMEEARYWVGNMPKNPGLLYQNSIDRLDEFYLLAKLRTTILAINHDLVHSTKHMYRFKALGEEFVDRSVREKRLSRLYLSLYSVKTAENTGEQLLIYIDTLKGEIPHYDTKEKQIDDGPKLAKHDAELLYGLGLNHASHLKVHEGKKWVKVHHNMFKEALNKGAFLQKGMLPDRIFINHMQTLCKSGYHHLAKKFFDKNVHILETNYEETVSDFCLGLILYYQENMNQSWKIVTKLKNRISTKTDPMIIPGTRALLCALWYEVGELDLMVHEANAFRIWIGRETKRMDVLNYMDKEFCKVILGFERTIRGQEDGKYAGLIKLKTRIEKGKISGVRLLSRMVSKELKPLIEKQPGNS